MKQNKLSFESESFQFHYLTLNLQFNNFKRIKKLADYLSKTFDCNSVFIDCKDSTKNCPLIKNERSFCKAEFRVNSQKYWSGTALSFSGNQSTYLYKMIQETGLSLDWEAFDFGNTNVSRIDVCYDRKLKESDKVELFDSFGKRCEEQIKKAIFKKGVIRVGERGSGNYFRAYRRENGKEIRFELELSKAVVKKFQFYLFSNQFEKLEELLCIQFYEQALSSFVKDSVYTDWLLKNFRNMRSSRRYENSLITTYFKNLPLKTIEKQEFLYKLLQLLSYIRTLESSVDWISNENYRVVSFRVSEFLEFVGKKKTNYYQIRKLVDFLKSLQSLPPVLEDFPKEFLTYVSFSTTELKKEFKIQEVLDRVRLSPQKIRKLRKSILITFEDAKNLKVIEPQFTLLMKTNESKEVEKLTSNLLVKTKSVFYTEIP